MKCSRCHEDKTEDQFAWRNKAKGWRYAYCKPCRKQYDQERYKNKNEVEKERLKQKRLTRSIQARQLIWNHLSTHPCIDCDESDPLVLQFDHVRGEKKYTIATMREQALDTIRKEIAKCDIRCANCHQRKTALEQGWYKELRG